MAEPVVRLERVSKRYGKLLALDSVSLEIRAGEIFALLGPNGAGKTTLISIVAGLVRASEGSVTVLGKDVVRDYRETRRSIGLVPQEINFDPFFTVEETLRIQAGYFGVRLQEERLTEILKALDLEPKRKASPRSLSGGMRRRLLIGKALVHEPKVLFLDEPTAGVDVELRHSLWNYVRTLRDRGTTVVLTTHYLEEAEELAERVGVVDHGKLLIVDEKTALLERHASRELRAVLAVRLDALPASLVALGMTLEMDGRSVHARAKPGETFGRVLAALAAAGIAVTDVETARMGLEDVFVELLHAAPKAVSA